jgi:hypothetical protein
MSVADQLTNNNAFFLYRRIMQTFCMGFLFFYEAKDNENTCHLRFKFDDCKDGVK